MLHSRRLRQRAILMSSLRSFFAARGFLEVDTPIRQPVIIPERNIEPLRSGDAFLQTSPELSMKRLLAQGCSKIFQICPCFRKNEKGRRHLEEFTMLEWYHSGENYQKLMEDCEHLLRHVLRELSAADALEDAVAPFFPGYDLQKDWEKITVKEAFQRYSPCSLQQSLSDNSFDEILVEYVEPHLGMGSPAFLIDYPLELGSLARAKADNPHVVERFELYLGGVELANGFTELTDEGEQRRRFCQELKEIENSWGPDLVMPERFLFDLGRLQGAAGIALGVDRLLMLALGIDDINDVVTFSPADFF
ncbi:EF-P lysine aminoacylase EpmA [Desulforhopalus sp. IMCC35007]|uniref:EF-P lysine aminoacylase EpmA n=1 Tax=Desulforhopalus sp. IMCC35007 TaxID=2569543 RepID=UPI0010AE1A96|nr:EF-P lysine aminoacylase EpmA [Desulforhopalus sp. IMCC35007]TKB12204.1 EF-P lysine aminoacylase GenX [Desulforhopalus sp. IMCC35007]